MKSLLIVSLLFCFSCSAQNWRVMSSVDRFNYGSLPDSSITVTIFADSISTNGADTTFYLNRIFCDSCYAIASGSQYICDTCYGLRNQPQFLQRVLIQKSNGVVNMLDSGNFVIRTLDGLGSSWLYDSLHNITATISSESITTIFGIQDSVKTISLSSGNSIILSKQFGIIDFPDETGGINRHYLLGIEGRNLGKIVPGFRQIFDFNVGDMFQMHSFVYDGSGLDNYEIIKKYIIDSKIISNDSIEYCISGNERLHRYCTDPFVCFTFWDYTNYIAINSCSLIFIDSVNNITNKYNNELIKIDNSFYTGIFSNLANTVSSQELYSPIITSKDSLGIFQKSITGVAGFDNYYPGFYLIGHYESDTSSSIMIPCNGSGNCSGVFNTAVFADRLGQVYWGLSGGEHTEFGYLEAYRKGNDTVGTFTPDYLLDGINEFQPATLHVYPNPADKIIHISINDEFSYSIIDVLNNEVTKNTLQKESGIDVSNLSNGIYFLKLISRGNQYFSRILVEH